jgi:hypothetical protein
MNISMDSSKYLTIIIIDIRKSIRFSKLPRHQQIHTNKSQKIDYPIAIAKK